MDSDDALTAIEVAEAMASPGPPSWNSPLDDDDQRTYMAALVEAYAADELVRAEEQDEQYRIGDIGCGDGTFARDLATYYDSADYPETTVIGVDRSRKHAHAATYDQENAIAVGADAGELLPYLDDLDFAYAVNVLQDDPSLLEPLSDTVDYLVATVPNTEGIPHEVSKADSGALRYDTGVDLPYLVFDEMAVDGVEMTMHATSESAARDVEDVVEYRRSRGRGEHGSVVTVRAGEFGLLPMVTYPHRFWTVTGDELEAAAPSGDDVHLMVSVRDPETGTVLPAETGLELRVGPAGEPGSVHTPWPMLSQEMGFHFGDNVPLGEDGTYEVSVRVGAIDAELTGAFAGRFDEPGEASFTFEFDQAFRNEVVAGIEYVDEEYRGAHGALANHMAGMHHDGEDGGNDADGAGEPPHGREQWREGEGRHRFGTYRRGPDAAELLPAADLPGTLQGTPLSGDAVLATTLFSGGSRFVDGDARYLAVSPRTPYNRGTIPMTNLAFEQVRDGETLASGDLRATLDPELGYHYGASLADAADGDDLTVRVETPPQAARHAGYETAFLEMPPVTLTLEVP